MEGRRKADRRKGRKGGEREMEGRRGAERGRWR